MTANPEGVEAGRGRRQVVRFAAALLVFALAACGRREEASVRAEPGEAALRSPAGTVLSNQGVARLVRGAIADSVAAAARIEADPRLDRIVTAPAAGRIEGVRVRTPEERVRAGETLAWLVSPELGAAQREYLLSLRGSVPGLSAKAEERLRAMGLAPDLIGKVRAAGRPLERIPIRSPQDGFLIGAGPPPASAGGPAPGTGATTGPDAGMGGMEGMGPEPGGSGSAASGASAAGAEASMRSGARVERGAVLARINPLTRVAAVIALPVHAAGRIRVGDSVRLDLPGLPAGTAARVDFLEARVADTGGHVQAFAYLPDPDHRLRPGAMGTARVAAPAESAWVLPRAAVHGLGDRHVAWVRNRDDTGAFEAREIRIGRQGADRVEILAGLEPGEAVAAQAALLADPDGVLEPRPLGQERAGSAAGPEAHGQHGKPDAAAGDPHAGHAAGGPKGAVVRVPEGQARLAGISTAPVAYAHLVPSRTFRAVTAFDSRSREEVAARVSGRVAELRVQRPGERIGKGQVIAVLHSEELAAAQEEYLALRRGAAGLAQPELMEAQSRAARRRMRSLGLSEAALAALATTGRAATEFPVASPREGILLEARVQAGASVAAGEPLVVLGRDDQVWVETWLLAGEAEAFSEGTEARVQVEGLAGDPLPGRLEHVRQSTALSGSVTLAHVSVPGAAGRILPGMRAQVTFVLPGRHVLAVPASALLRSSGMTMAWVQSDGQAYSPRKLKTGLETPEGVEVREGLREGERVVVSGAYLLNSEWTYRQGAGTGHSGH